MPEDAFDILGLEPRYDLTETAIERAWLAKMATAHPDVAAAEVVGEMVGGAGDLASKINRAKGELEDDETRANLVLARLGGPSADQDNALPQEFLLEIFSIREDMEQQLATRGDDARRELRAWADGQREELARGVGALFEKADDPQVRWSIRQNLNVWRYIERMIEQLDPGYNPNVADFK